MRHRRTAVLIGLATALAVLPACGARMIRPERFVGRPEALYAAGLAALGKKDWDNAVIAFEKLTTDLGRSDKLVPLSHFRLAEARTGKEEYLLAAQSFARVAEEFPEDTLAPEALLRAGQSYQRLWRSPEHDPGYGTTAQSTYRTLVAIYPDAKQVREANQQLGVLDQWFASKEYLTGFYYLKRKAYDPAIIYFKAVITNHPETPRVRDAYLRLVESYRAIRYAEEAEESCTAVRARWGQDAEVQRLCPVTKPAAPAVGADSARAPRPTTAGGRVPER
jgi:outer membrane protein assembly factor BamD